MLQDFNSWGRAFHTEGPEKVKALSPNPFRRVRGTGMEKLLELLDLSDREGV